MIFVVIDSLHYLGEEQLRRSRGCRVTEQRHRDSCMHLSSLNEHFTISLTIMTDYFGNKHLQVFLEWGDRERKTEKNRMGGERKITYQID